MRCIGIYVSSSVFFVISFSSVASIAAAEKTEARVADKRVVDFRSEIYPLLKTRCFHCHEGANPDSGYRLDVYDDLLGYSTGEPFVLPGQSNASRLIKLVESQDELDRMPPMEEGDALTDPQVALLRAWIDQGAKWDEKLLPPPNRESDHWAFQAVTRPPVPVIASGQSISGQSISGQWISNPVDAFIAAKHESAKVTPAPPASRRLLIRRLFLDLVGMPPTSEEVDTFVNDKSPHAYERWVERLLHSRHYGERWGRYWLDLARWTESHGYQHDLPRPYAWRYRDYVIDSFNVDKPYDRFLAEQIAGDELRPYCDENLIATGFLAAARISGNQMNKAMQRNDVLVDVVNTTASALLGLTLSCAQCHNHKFDPLTQRDYYRFQAFFVRGQLGNLSLQDSDVSNPTELSRWMPKATFDFYQREAKKLEKRKLWAPPSKPHTWGYFSPATGDPAVERMPVVNRDPIPYHPESLKRTSAHLLIRGDADSPGFEVESGWPEVLSNHSDSGSTGDVTEPTSKPALARSRVALAEWMSDRSNPLVSRVWVNRIWQYHFGRGLVATPSDFGTQGAQPSHPALLDWLAAELMDHGWSTKHIHRLIVLSNTYRQSRENHIGNAAIDPDNVWLWNWPLRRMEAEAIRDTLLVATGELDRQVGGPSVPPAREEESLRRTIYLYQRRSEMPSMMAMFDAPDGIVSCSRRDVSTVALQPLFMLNSRFMTRRAVALAAKVHEIAGDDPTTQVKVAFRRTLGRLPEPSELEQSLKLLRASGADSETDSEIDVTTDVTTDPSSADDDRDSLARFCHALINLNEFVYIP